jgi:hypothetical protein
MAGPLIYRNKRWLIWIDVLLPMLNSGRSYFGSMNMGFFRRVIFRRVIPTPLYSIMISASRAVSIISLGIIANPARRVPSICV